MLALCYTSGVLLAIALMWPTTAHAYYFLARHSPHSAYINSLLHALRPAYAAALDESDAEGSLGVEPSLSISGRQVSPCGHSKKSVKTRVKLTTNLETTADKRSALAAKGMPRQEHVCEMKIIQNYEPQVGHEQNGSRVEIQQDDEHWFRTTYVECEESRVACHGIDGGFASECVTVYDVQRAWVRPEGADVPFVEGHVKIPITCQCRLLRKLRLE